MNSETLFIIADYYIAVISILLGIYCLYINPKEKINRIFFSVCASFGIWVLGHALFLYFKNIELMILFQRISIIGYFFLFAFWLHFTLVFSKKNQLLKQKNFLALIYLPAVVVLIEFFISSFTKHGNFQLIYQIMNSNYIDDLFFLKVVMYIYEISFPILSVIIMSRYIKELKDEHEIINKNLKVFVKLMLIIISFEFILSIIFEKIFISAIVGLISLLFIFHIMLKEKYLIPVNKVIYMEILDKKNQQKTFGYLALIYFFGGIFSFFITIYIYGYLNYLLSIIASLLMIFVGIILLILSKIRTQQHRTEMALYVVSFLGVPIIALAFLPFGSISMWAVSLLFIIASIMFTKRSMMMIFSASIISTQLLVWILKPGIQSLNDEIDISTKLILLSILITLTFYFNHIYLSRLIEKNSHTQINNFLEKTSHNLIRANEINIEITINKLLEDFNKLFVSDISFLKILNFEDLTKDTIKAVSIWSYYENTKIKNNYENVTLHQDLWNYNQLHLNEVVVINNICENSKSNVFNPERKEIGVKSMIATPIFTDNGLCGLIGVQNINRCVVWSDEQVNTIKILSNIIRDTFERINDQKEIKKIVFHDTLTELPNRRMFDNILENEIKKAKENQQIISVMLLDVDNFKRINDSIGHKGGNEILCEIAKIIKKSLRNTDVLSRTGEDEFLIMINSVHNEKEPETIIKKIMRKFQKPVILNNREFLITFSTGISMFPFDGSDSATLIRNADTAMYKAKEEGKNRYVICSESLKEDIKNNILINEYLRNALYNNEFYLVYQPQVIIETGEISGVEALIRWNNQDLGNIPPSRFIPIAENIGLINDIGEWVIQTACIQNKKWQDMDFYPIRMAVNVSAMQLDNNKIFIHQLKNILKKIELDPQFLEIEITESVAMGDELILRDTLNEIEKLGITISIDDFGTQYSSLVRLKMLPIRKLKIDKKFIDGIGKKNSDNAIVKSIIDLGKNLDLIVVAEGVENKQQLEFLRKNSCDKIQGYYYHSPMCAKDIPLFLKHNS